MAGEQLLAAAEKQLSVQLGRRKAGAGRKAGGTALRYLAKAMEDKTHCKTVRYQDHPDMGVLALSYPTLCNYRSP